MKTVVTTLLTLALVLVSSLPAVRAAALSAVSEPPVAALAPPEPDDGPYRTTVSLRHAKDLQRVRDLGATVLQAEDSEVISSRGQTEVAGSTPAMYERCEVGDGCYDPRYDFDADGTITVVDIMQVAMEWGWSCGSGVGAVGTEVSSATLLPAWVRGQTQSALVAIVPTTSTVELSETFTFSMVISDVVNLGAFQFDMVYEPDVVHVEDVALGPFLGSSGRTAIPLTPEIDNHQGLTKFGAYSMSYPPRPGPDGSGVLAWLTLTAQGIGSTALDLRDVQVVTPDGGSIPTADEDGIVRVRGHVYLPVILRR